VTLPGNPASGLQALAVSQVPAGSTVVDPFGLWQPAAHSPAPAAGDMLSFDVPGDVTPAAVWTLALTSGPQGRLANERELERLAEKVQAIEAGLDASGPRVEALLSARLRSPESSEVSFSTGANLTLEALSPPEALPPPEAGLIFALSSFEPVREGDEVSFGLPGAQKAALNWGELYQRLSALVDSTNHLLLHFAWVDTTLDEHLVARTTVNWGGDFITYWQPGLSQDQMAAHCRSLDLAITSRMANMRAILTVTQIAGKIALAVTTPLGPIQAMSLAWQFVNEVISK
jgi:hypothetical protein